MLNLRRFFGKSSVDSQESNETPVTKPQEPKEAEYSAWRAGSRTVLSTLFESAGNDSSLTDTSQSDNMRSLENYQLLKVIGKGCMGKVLLGREKSSQKVYAIKSISKKWVLSHGKQEVEHIMAEQKILASLSQIRHPFLIRLHCSFQDHSNLFLILEYVSGGDLATQLELYGRFDLERSRFYCAEMISGILELHRLGIIYRDLKPENVLLSPDGHIKLTDFGLSKQFKLSTKLSHDENECIDASCNCFTTKTFCGTAEYLPPEILLEQPYSFEVDFWSLGTFLYEMIVGITPFWADNHSTMYQRVLNDALEFPSEFPCDRARDFIVRLLERDPQQRLGFEDLAGAQIMAHSFFGNINWNELNEKKVVAPFAPQVKGEMDVRWFDKTFTRLPPKISPMPFSPENNSLRANNNCHDAFQGYTYLSSSAQVLMQSFGKNRGNIEARLAKRRRLREMRSNSPTEMVSSPIDSCAMDDDHLEFNFEDL